MKGARTHGVPLSSDAINVLRRLKALNLKTRRKALKSRARRGKDELAPDCGRVFQYDCKPIDDCNTKAFQDAVERAGVGPLHWHSLRHLCFLGRTQRCNAARTNAAGGLGELFHGAQIRPPGTGSSVRGRRESHEFLAQKPAHWQAAKKPSCKCLILVARVGLEPTTSAL